MKSYVFSKYVSIKYLRATLNNASCAFDAKLYDFLLIFLIM
jgi:hypothetical protein